MVLLHILVYVQSKIRKKTVFKEVLQGSNCSLRDLLRHELNGYYSSLGKDETIQVVIGFVGFDFSSAMKKELDMIKSSKETRISKISPTTSFWEM